MNSEMKNSEQGKKQALVRVPELRFPEFWDSTNWDKKELNKLLTIGSGKDYKHLSIGDIPVYGSGGYMLSVSDFLYDGESVCIGRKGTINKPMFLTGKFWTVDTLFYTHSFIKCSPKFIFYQFQRINWLSYNEAGGIPSLSKTTIGKIEILVPSTSEQKKIADCLSSLDNVMSLQTEKIDALRRYKNGLMQKLFPAEGEMVPELRFPEFCDEKEWQEKQLQSICQMKAGKFISASKINQHPAEGLYPCYGGNGLRGFTSEYSHSGEYSLIGRQGALCGNITFANGDFYATEHAVVVTPSNGVNNNWLFYCLNKLKLNQYAIGQAQPGLSVNFIEKIIVQIPSKEKEQKKIADCLSSLDELITKETQKLATLKMHKTGLMQQLFPSMDEVTA